MSLINDALKRAQQTPPPPVPALPLRPVEAAAKPASNHAWMVPLVAALLVFAVLFLVWRTLANRPTRHTEAATPNSDLIVQAKTLDQARPTVEPPQTPVPPVAAPEPEPEPAPAPAAVTTAPSAPAPEPAPTPAPAVSTPEPPPLRLQAIVYHPTRPSALISGKTLFIGDKLGEWRLTSITRETVTLAGNGQSKVLALPE